MSNLPMKFNPGFLDEKTLVNTFVIRAREFGEVMEIVRANTSEVNRHVLLLGVRGAGKTTLALRVAAEVRRNPDLENLWYPVVFSEESYEILSAGEFWQEALFHIGEQTGERKWQEARDELDSEPDEERLRQRALARLMEFSDERKQRLLLVVENLDMLIGDQMDKDEDAQALLSVLMTEPRVMLLGTTNRSFGAISKAGALEKLFHVVSLNALESPEDVSALWRLSSEDVESRIPVRPIEILTGGNPRLIRILAEFAARTSFRELMSSLVRLVDDHTEYFKQQIDALPARERKVFVALADRWDRGSARDLVAATRLGVSQVSASLNRLEKKGMVTLHRQTGRTKVYDVAERLFNIYHLMRRRRQASARVKATVRFMIQMYEGEELLSAMRALADEACSLNAVHRRDHYLAYLEILDLADPNIRDRILAETRDQILSLSDVPDRVRERLAEENAYDGMSQDELFEVDINSMTTKDVIVYVHALAVPRGHEADIRSFLAIVAALDHAIELDQGLTVAHLCLGIAQKALGLQDKAIVSFDRALELDPDNVLANEARGTVLSSLGRLDEAIVSFDRALELQPDNPEIINRRGRTLGALGRFDEALDSFNHFLELVPDDVSTLVSRGYALQSLGLFEEALDSLDRAIEIDPDDGPANLGKGMVYSQTKQPQNALSAYERALEVDPDGINSNLGRATILGMLGRETESLDAFDRVLELEPTNAVAYCGRGLALKVLGRLEEALLAFDRSLEIDSNAAVTNGLLGTTLVMLGRFEEAIDMYDRAINLDPYEVWYRINRGKAVSNLGRKEEALSVFKAELNSPEISEHITAILDLATSLVVRGGTKSVLHALESSPGAKHLEPLIAALRMDLGEPLDVAREIEEVAEDILVRFHEQRAILK